MPGEELEKQESTQEAAQEANPLDQLFSKVNLEKPKEAKTLDNATDSSDRLAFAIKHLVDAVSKSDSKVDKIDKVFVDGVIASIDDKISAQINEILHHPKFKDLESSWRGLHFAVKRTDFRQNIQMEILNCSKDKLKEDFEDAPETVQSGLYLQMYDREYDQPGAIPFSSMVANYEFDHSRQSTELLRNISKVAAATHCPFISSVGAKFFESESIDVLTNTPDIGSIFKKNEYMNWNSFRTDEDSRYVGLTLNKFLLRLPYSEENKVKTFNLIEDVENVENYLWGNPAFAFLANINRSFAKHGWAVNIRGPKAGGKVEDLPAHVYKSSTGNQLRIPTEIMLSERKEFELAENGFIPLTVYKNQDFAVFFSAQSTQKPLKYNTAEATANAKLCANLPYLYLVSRLSHYTKVMQREEIGGQKEANEIQNELNAWVQTLVIDSPNPMPEQKAKYPLREAAVKVTENEDSPGYYNVTMKVRPHFQVEGVNVDLSLVSRVPKE